MNTQDTSFFCVASDNWITDNIEQIGKILRFAYEDIIDEAYHAVENYGGTFEEALRDELEELLDETRNANAVSELRVLFEETQIQDLNRTANDFHEVCA